MSLRALIFDVDGTLADTERDGHRLAFNAAFRDAGLDWDWDVGTYGRLLDVTGGKERMRHYVEHHRPAVLRTPDLGARIAALHAAKTRHYGELLATGALPLRPGVARLLLEARTAGLRLAIATTTTRIDGSIPSTAASGIVSGMRIAADAVFEATVVSPSASAATAAASRGAPATRIAGTDGKRTSRSVWA